jgi:SH3 domain protein
MIKRSVLRGIFVLCAGSLVSLAAFAESVWVSDQLQVMLRTGPSTEHAIQLMIGSGAELEVLEQDDENGYSRVMTSGGTEGWVLSRFLMTEPGARAQLESLSRQLMSVNAEGTSMSSQLGAIQGEYETTKRRISELEQDKSDMQAEIDDIRRAAGNALAIDSQNKNLQQLLADAEIRLSIIEQENDSLVSQKTRNWFIAGALVLIAGILLGLVLPRMKWQKKARYDRF